MFPLRAPVCVGVKVTLILQLFPTASVLPQGVGDVVGAKSPLIAMLLMFSVAVPVFLTVTVFTEEVVPSTMSPHVSAAGVRLTIGFTLAFTVRLTLVW